MLRRKREIEVRPADHPHPMHMFFEGLRRRRREHYEDRAARPPARRAILTMVNNEPLFFPIWLGYYSRFFAADDIYVLDHETDDGTLSGGGFVRIPVRHGLFDQTWMVETMREHQNRLLDDYDIVVTADVDEIIAPLPEWGTLGQYLDRFDEEFVNAFGYELIHLADREPPFDPSGPVFGQRRYWFANDAYDKPVVSMVPMDWKPGFHERRDGEKRWDPDLRLIHLHRLDYEICAARHRQRRKGGWGERDLREGWGAHYRIRGRRRFDRWFYGHSGWEDFGIEMEIQEIPASWRELL